MPALFDEISERAYSHPEPCCNLHLGSTRIACNTWNHTAGLLNPTPHISPACVVEWNMLVIEGLRSDQKWLNGSVAIEKPECAEAIAGD
jgi:hypothetical protein